MSQPRSAYEPVIVIVEPQRIEHEQLVADHLLAGRAVLVDLQHTDTETAHRIISFLEGALYGVNGEVTQIRDNLLLLASQGMVWHEEKVR